MLLIGYLTERLERKKPESVYLVGGQAVETYTAGQFRTGDIDIVTPDSETAEEIFLANSSGSFLSLGTTDCAFRKRL